MKLAHSVFGVQIPDTVVIVCPEAAARFAGVYNGILYCGVVVYQYGAGSGKRAAGKSSDVRCRSLARIHRQADPARGKLPLKGICFVNIAVLAAHIASAELKGRIFTEVESRRSVRSFGNGKGFVGA